jgi:small-conductance mechanosensitive channel
MPPRLKRFIGMLILVALVVLYALIATTVATYRLAESPWYIHLAFFALFRPALGAARDGRDQLDGAQAEGPRRQVTR